MKHFSSISKGVLPLLMVVSSLLYSQRWNSAAFTPAKHSETPVLSTYSPPVGIQRTPAELRSQEVIDLIGNVYIELSEIFEDGPTLEERFFTRKLTLFGSSSDWVKKNTKIEYPFFRPRVVKFFNRKRFFLNGGVS